MGFCVMVRVISFLLSWIMVSCVEVGLSRFLLKNEICLVVGLLRLID